MKAARLIPLFFLMAFVTKAQFLHKVPISTPTSLYDAPNWCIPADLDQDGDIDLVSASIFNKHVVWFENLDGQGDYDDPRVVADLNWFGPDKLYVADFEGDADPDVLVWKDGEYRYFSNLSRPSPNFSEAVILPLEGEDLIIMDVNGDDLPDIMARKILIQQVGWYANTGNGFDFDNFQVLISGATSSFRAADLDGDSDFDLISMKGDSLVWWENTGVTNNFGAYHPIAAESGAIKSIQVVDLDGDSDLEVVTMTSATDANLKWYENTDGQGAFGPTLLFLEPGNSASLLRIADLDNDQDLDVVFSRFGSLALLENIDGNGNFSPPQHIALLHATVKDLHFADVNNDGLPDLIAPAYSHTQGIEEIAVIKNKGALTFANRIDIMTDADDLTLLEQHDIDGDGIPEIVTGHKNYSKLAWQKFDNSPRRFSNPTLIPTLGGNPGAIEFSDLDGDGDQDLLVSFIEYEEKIVWFEKLDDGPDFGAEDTIAMMDGGLGANPVKAADFDGDGDQDVFVHLPFGNPRGVFWCENLGNATAFSPPIPISSGNPGFFFAVPTDLDSDGDMDVLVSRSNPATTFWYENLDGSGSFSALQVIPDLNVTASFYLDFDHDGREDLIVRNNDGIFWCKKLEEGPDFGAAIPILAPLPFSFNRMKPVDLDRDDHTDIILLVGFSQLYWIRNLGEQAGFSQPLPLLGDFSASHDVFFLDVDGDRDLDLISYSIAGEMLFLHESLLGKPSVKGFAYLDENENAAFDPGEKPLYLQTMTLQPGALASFSDEAGYTYFLVDEGTYELSCTPSEDFTLTTPAAVSLEFMEEDGEAEAAFGLIGNEDKLDALMAMTSAPTRCGFIVPFWLDYRNIGTLIADGALEVELDPLVTLVSAQPAPDSIVGNTLYWHFEDLYPTYAGQIVLYLEIPGVEFLGEWLSFSSVLNLTSQDGSQTGLEAVSYRAQVNCAYDPNDKLVEPNVPGFDNYTLFGDTLDYTVRFQNTGTDTAFFVLIEDFLDPHLDWNSLLILGASHAFQAQLDLQSGRLTFSFENILLPDSTTNEPASHGYVRFRILHREGLPENTWVANTANIYFDYNPPVVTNTVYNVLVSEYPLLLRITPPLCHGDATGSIEVVFALSQNEYVWSNGQTGALADSLEAGSYQLLVNTVVGVVIDTVLHLPEPDSLAIGLLDLQPVLCFEDSNGFLSVEVQGGTPSYSFEWNNGAAEPNNGSLPSGVHTLTVTDSNGCQAVETYTIPGPEAPLVLTVTSTPAQTGQMNGTATADASGGTPPYSYTWSASGQSGSQIEGLSPGEYTVTVTDANGCEVIQAIVVDQVNAVRSVVEGTYFWVAPNPANGPVEIGLEAMTAKDREIWVQNGLGQVLEVVRPTRLQQRWALSLLPGVYAVALVEEGAVVKALWVVVK